jgi:hypothetical protein
MVDVAGYLEETALAALSSDAGSPSSSRRGPAARSPTRPRPKAARKAAGTVELAAAGCWWRRPLRPAEDAESHAADQGGAIGIMAQAAMLMIRLRRSGAPAPSARTRYYASGGLDPQAMDAVRPDCTARALETPPPSPGSPGPSSPRRIVDEAFRRVNARLTHLLAGRPAGARARRPRRVCPSRAGRCCCRGAAHALTRRWRRAAASIHRARHRVVRSPKSGEAGDMDGADAALRDAQLGQDAEHDRGGASPRQAATPRAWRAS